MIYIQSFKNYDEFQKLFPVVKHGNGVTSRKNKILLGCLKDRRFIRWWLQFRDEYVKHAHEEDKPVDILQCKNMEQLKSFIKVLLYRYVPLNELWSRYDSPLHKSVLAGGWIIYSCRFQADNKGLCADGDPKCVRYENLITNRIYKMKAGKFITECMQDYYASFLLPEQAQRWIGEEFAKDWEAYAKEKIGNAENLTLCVGSTEEDFADIYDGELCVGDFGSCMEDNDQFSFYVNSVEASAACLRNADGNIVARCVIFDNVRDEDGNTWRLAERQYATGGQDVLKQILVNKLIAAGRIDGYKKVGVNCHDNRNFISVSGESLSEKHFCVDCNLDEGDTLSYQDSFKYYDYKAHVACNYQEEGYNDELDTTEGEFVPCHLNEEWSDVEQEWIPCDEAIWDEYNDSYISGEKSSIAVYHGVKIHLSDYMTDDFYWSNSEDCYIYEDECKYVERYDDYFFDEEVVEDIDGHDQLISDCVWSEYTYTYLLEEKAVYSNAQEDYLLKDAAFYSELLADWFSSEDDKDKAEELHRKEHALMCIA